VPPWVQYSTKPSNPQYPSIPLTAEEVVDLASAFELFGYWRLDIDSGHLFATEDICRIFGLPPTEGPLNLVTFTSRIHPDDMPVLMEIYERISQERLVYQNVYRVKSDGEGYKYVRSVGRFRDKPGTGGEIVGFTEECCPQTPAVTFSEPTAAE
jgi:PAS domain-containing protein